MSKELREAAQAVLDRWDSVDWKAPPTADYMERLRKALAAEKPPPTPVERWTVTLAYIGGQPFTAEVVLASQYDALLALSADSNSVPFIQTGCKDANGDMICLGDRVRYRLDGKHTKPEYWNPEYEVIWDPPSFALKHVGGGLDSGTDLFKLRYGGSNGHLVIVDRAKRIRGAALDSQQPQGCGYPCGIDCNGACFNRGQE